MPAGSRVRANNVYGTISDNPLLIGATSFTSLGLSLLPAIVSPTQHAVIVFDPKRVFGEPEIVVVTSHLALGTTATITRAQYGTTARAHNQGTAWAHVPVGPDDYIAIVTSVTRPSNPYDGQVIYETDTNRWSSRSSAGIWIPAPMNVPACRVFNSAVQNIPNTTETVITFDSERYDTDSMHSIAVNTGRITFNTAGVYAVTGVWTFAPGTVGTRELFIRLNATGRYSALQTQNTALQGYLVAATVDKFIVGDFIELRAFQNSGGGLNTIVASPTIFCEFSASWIGVGS